MGNKIREVRKMSKNKSMPKVDVKKEEAPNTKTYSLDKKELGNLSNRMELKERYQYIASLIEKDMHNYVDIVVKKRLNIPLGSKTEISFQSGTIIVTETKETK